ncbi:hypothetical protein EW145_g478 [Phellinidium pouzarii]|uniref:DUF300-domain-containing protein n=1 Tax=Phellinidium pouzarii TaxID=167371 RepID=A0A4S4LNQ3_9AGAM|nr:hypothetical protein EW145_g478 [Phellinidium pouzarii]
MVIRIMLMVPIYAIASLISLFSLNAAFVIDAIRDIYEAFVIYCFFNLLLGYLGGERSLLILLHGREPKNSVFPMNLFKKEIDVSDPYFFLFLKRGIIQYVEVKPILAIATLILKAMGKYNDGNLRANSGYLYISIIYNVSICLSLYCLALFWMCVNKDLKPFRPVPKFLSAGAIKHLGPYTDSEHISIGLTDALICFEMPIFAIAHMYAFSHTDYIDRNLMYAARMPMYYAFRDAFGLRDVIEDSKSILRGEGMDYREFEPAEGFIHKGSGRERRIQAGLRYAQGGQKKYWLPMPADVTEHDGTPSRAIRGVGINEDDDEVYAPLLEDQAATVVHDTAQEKTLTERRGFELPYDDPDEEEEALYEHSRNYLFGDYLYPCIDVSSEYARRIMWEEEERILQKQHGSYLSPIRGVHSLLGGEKRPVGYGSMRPIPPIMSRYSSSSDSSGTSSAKGKGKGRINHTQDMDAPWTNGGPVIDKHDNFLPAPEDGLRLGWTKDSRRVRSPKLPRSPTLSRSPLLREAHASLSSRDHPAPSSPAAGGLRVQKLPTDAVDLVVENDAAAEDEMIHERRRGEPGVRGSGWRKAYTRGLFVPDRKVEQSNIGNVRGAVGTIEAIDDVESRQDETGFEVGELEVARAATPPPHAQVPDSIILPTNEENPWAR